MSRALLHQSNKRTGFSWWNHALIDWILTNPGRPAAEAAKALGRSVTTIHMVTSSDLFKAELARRRKELTKQIDTELVRKATSVADKALGRLEEKLDGDEAVKISPTTLMDIADRALNRLGYGTNPEGAAGPGGGQVQVNIQVNADVLAQAREKARQAQADMITVNPSPKLRVTGEAS